MAARSISETLEHHDKASLMVPDKLFMFNVSVPNKGGLQRDAGMFPVSWLSSSARICSLEQLPSSGGMVALNALDDKRRLERFCQVPNHEGTAPESALPSTEKEITL